MGSELDFVAKYGPIGLLAILFLSGARMGNKIVDRLYLFFDKIDQMLDAFLEKMSASELSAEKRHASTREFIENSAKDTRHSIRQDITRQLGDMDMTLARIEAKLDGRRLPVRKLGAHVEDAAAGDD